jgi:hypothetical protein
MTCQRAALPICLVFDGLADLSCAGFDLIRVLSQIWSTDPPGVRLLATISAASV